MDKKQALTKDQLFAAAKGRLEEVEIPELGGTVYLAQMTAADILPFMDSTDGGGVVGMNARQNMLLVHFIVDEDGNRIFADDDAEKMNELPWDIYMRIVRKITGRIAGAQEAVPLQDGGGSPSSSP